MKQSCVLVTGGTGFLGVHLSRLLLRKKYKVILLDTAPLTAKDLAKKVTVINADICNTKALNTIFLTHHIDFVVHAAAALPIQREKKIIFDTNVNGTRNILNVSHKYRVKKFIFISTTAVYGVPQHLPETETDPTSPIGHYGESKLLGERLCKQYDKKGLPTIIFRPKTFLGPERLGVFTLWFEAIFSNKPVFLLGSGNNLYQLLAVEDLCTVIEKALQSRKHGQIYNVGAKEFGTWKSDLQQLIVHAKSTSTIVGFPVKPSQFALSILESLNLSPIVAWHYKTLPVNSYVDITKATSQLDFHPTKSNSDILIESYDWYKKNRSSLSNIPGTTHRTTWNFKALNLITRFV